MNSKKDKTSDPYSLTDEINLKRSDKYVALSNLSMYLLFMEKFKKAYKSNKFNISAHTWNEEFELPDGSYSISDVQDYFEYIY